MDKSKKQKWLKLALGLIVTVALLWFVFSKVNWVEFLTALSSVNLLSVALALGFMLGARFLYGMKWWVLAPGERLLPMIRAYFKAQPFFMLPMGGFTGDAARISLMRRGAKDAYKVASATVIDRLTMPLPTLVVTLPLFTLMGARLPWGGWAVAFLILIAVVCAGSVVLLLSQRGRGLLLRALSFLKRWKWGNKAYVQLEKTASSLEGKNVAAWRVVACVGLGFLGDVAFSMVYASLGPQMGAVLDFSEWIWLFAVASIATTLVYTAGGLGVREGAVVGILAAKGVATGTGMTLSLLYTGLNALSILVCWCLGSLFGWDRSGNKR